MNTADEVLVAYREMISDLGQPVAIRRYVGTGPSRTHTDTATMAYVRNYGSSELVGAIAQGDQKAITLVDGLAGILPVLTSDKLVVDGKEFSIKNPMKRVVAGTLIALEIHAAG
jgi:hypothetical protein